MYNFSKIFFFILVLEENGEYEKVECNLMNYILKNRVWDMVSNGYYFPDSVNFSEISFRKWNRNLKNEENYMKLWTWHWYIWILHYIGHNWSIKDHCPFGGQMGFWADTYELIFLHDLLKKFSKIKTWLSSWDYNFFAIGAWEQILCLNKLKTRHKAGQKEIQNLTYFIFAYFFS